MSAQQLCNILGGRQGFTAGLAQRASRALGVSAAWLLFGEAGSGEVVGEGEAAYTSRAAVRVPIVGRVSANPRTNVIWEPVDPPEYAELPRGAVALEVRGDSMRPVALPGQHVLAVPGDPENGNLVAVEMKDGRQFFKRWWWTKGRERAILESVRREEIEPPVVVTRRQLRRVWRILGILF